jgi:uncharacterized protein YndB with AHSA1/START domain
MSQEATITRVFDAPREKMWRYFTEPELFAEWFGHDPYKTTATMDVREGGRWTAKMVSQEDGSEIPFVGKFVEVVEPERIVQTFEDVENPENTQTETLTTTLEDAGDGKTRVTYHQVGHMPAEEYGRVEEGVTGFYERLAERVERS